MQNDETPGMDRRNLLKRGAVVGGALVWTAPLVQTITTPAFAATSPGGQEIPGCVGKPAGTRTTYALKLLPDGSISNNNFSTEGGTNGPCGTLPGSSSADVSDGTLPPGVTVTFSPATGDASAPTTGNADSQVTIGLPAGTTATYVVHSGGGGGNQGGSACTTIQSASTTFTVKSPSINTNSNARRTISYIALLLSFPCP